MLFLSTFRRGMGALAHDIGASPPLDFGSMLTVIIPTRESERGGKDRESRALAEL
jgi:hypothetical protein